MLSQRGIIDEAGGGLMAFVIEWLVEWSGGDPALVQLC